MIICICHRVSDRTIAQCARAGTGFDELQFEHEVATRCGKCEGAALEIWARSCDEAERCPDAQRGLACVSA